jgi:hypothetical protein
MKMKRLSVIFVIIPFLILFTNAFLFGQTKDLNETLFLGQYKEYQDIKLGMDIKDFITKFRSKEVTDTFFSGMIIDKEEPEFKQYYEKASKEERKNMDDFIKISKEMRAFELLDLNKDHYNAFVSFYKGKITFLEFHTKCPFSELIPRGINLYGMPNEIYNYPTPDKVDKKKGLEFPLHYYVENILWKSENKNFAITIKSSIPVTLDEKKEPKKLRIKTEVKFSNNELFNAMDKINFQKKK